MSLTKVKEELDRTPLFQSRGGVQIGDNNIAKPFVRISLYNEALIISTFKKLIIPIDAIEGTGPSRFKGEKGVEIKFKQPGNWPYVRINSSNDVALETYLTELTGQATSISQAKENIPKPEDVFPGKLPPEYLDFLKENPIGCEIAFNEHKEEAPDFEGRYWSLMNETELVESWEMHGVGTAMNFECLKLYVQVQREHGSSEQTTSNVGKIELSRIESGFVIGHENGDWLYLDPADDYSVWIYYHDGGDVLRIADSFGNFANGKE